MLRPASSVLAGLLLGLALVAGSTTWGHAAEVGTDRVYRLDPADAAITFSVEEWGGLRTTEGRFATFSGTIVLDGLAPLSGRVDLVIDAASVEVAGAADERAWREHELRGADFFHADSFPDIRFVSHSLERLEGRQTRLHGELTIRGITRPASFSVQLWTETPPDGTEPRLNFTAEGEIDRSGYGMTAWMDVLGRQVQLSISGRAWPGEEVPPAGLL